MKLGLLDDIKGHRFDCDNIKNVHIHIEPEETIQFCSKNGKSFTARPMIYENPKNHQLYYFCLICSKKGKDKDMASPDSL
jgi:hypothetical protein